MQRTHILGRWLPVAAGLAALAVVTVSPALALQRTVPQELFSGTW